jgi:hypothetical protein
MKVYYAHSMGLYNTIQEQRDIKTLEALGFEVLNPNNPQVQARVDEVMGRHKIEHPGYPDSHYYRVAFKEIFDELVDQCQVFAFRALPDCRIPGGVGLELETAKEKGKHIIELPCNTIARTMTGEETREYLRDVGQR